MSDQVNITADMSVEELKVVLALEGHVPPFTIRRDDAGKVYRYATLEGLVEDFVAKTWWTDR